MESFLSLGRIHIPVVGLYSAAGLMAALALGLRTSGSARIDRDAFWDLSVFAVVAALVLSRLVLVLEDIHTFLEFPTMIFELPPVSFTALALTGFASLWYLRHKRLPVLGALDAAAPCAALFACGLNLGWFFGGLREGHALGRTWAVTSSFGRVHPFELYNAAAALAVCGLLVALLERAAAPGTTACVGLIALGLCTALSYFFHLPQQLYGTSALDGGQWRGLEIFVLGCILLAVRLALPARAPQPTPAQDLSRAL